MAVSYRALEGSPYRDRATANDLEANVCSFTYTPFRTVEYTLRVLVQLRLNKIRRETLDPVDCFL